jgi:hypothetical protein
MQHSIKSGGTKDHYRQVKVLGTVTARQFWYGQVNSICSKSNEASEIYQAITLRIPPPIIKKKQLALESVYRSPDLYGQ